MRMIIIALMSLFLLSPLAHTAKAANIGEEIEVTSGAITALVCAMEAKTTGKLDALSNCSMADTIGGFAVYDVAMKEVYKLAPTNVYIYELERAFGGGAIDLTGIVIKQSDGIAVIEVKEYTISARPKPGAFKGCL